ncbi:MAG: substrate-binding domain-containing protein [Verrucomicrobiota bacterium]
MPIVRRQSLPELSAGVLREGLLAGRWGATLPGESKLALELGVGRNTVQAALRLLEAEGLLGKLGSGRSRTVAQARPGSEARRCVLRVGVLLHERMVDENPGMQGILAKLQHEIEQAGHACFLSKPCQASLRHDPGRIAKYLAEMQADAWVVVAPRREVAAWFATKPLPSIALGGGYSDVNMAGTGTLVSAAHVEGFRRLLALGHKRIVMICLSHLRHPVPSAYVSRFTAELDSHHIPWNYPFNVPEWEESPAGFRAVLTKLFAVSPPTALLIDETPRLMATLGFLAEHGLRVPEQVSLFVGQWDSSLAWCHPPIAHVHWDDTPLVRRVLRWLSAVIKGCPDRKTVLFPAQFVPSGTIGPAGKG